MAYSTSPVTVRRLASMLRPLAEGLECEWTTEDGKSRYFAYKVREALAAAATNSEEFPELAAAAGRFKIEVDGRSRVVAVLKSSVTQGVQVKIPGRPLAFVESVAGSLDSIAEKWEQARDAGSNRLYLLDAGLSPAQLLELHSWAEEVGLMFFEDDGSLTLMEHDEASAPFAWTPEDLEENSDG